MQGLRRGKKLVQRGIENHGMSLLIVLGVTLFLTYPAFLSIGDFPSGIDTPAHYYKIELMQNMLQEHGTIFDWMNEWYGGMPFMKFYGPIPYLLLLVLDTILWDPKIAYNFFRTLLLFLTGVLVYYIVDDRIEDRSMALIGGILAVTAVPLHNNIFGVARVTFAAGLMFYLSTIFILLQDEIYSSSLNRYHLALSISLVLLLFTHLMTAYLLLLTLVIFSLVYIEKLKDLGVRPVIFVSGVVSILVMPELISTLRHSIITNPYWIRSASPPDLTLHLTRNFSNVRPRYLGFVHVGLILLGLLSTIYERSRFKMLAVLNLGFFYFLFWSYNLGVFHLLPFHAQFDMPRFEIMYMFWGVIVAVYGAKTLLSAIDLDLNQGWKWVFIALLVGTVMVDVAPLAESTQNWSPNFDGDKVELNESYRGVMVGARHWDAHMLPASFGVSNIFGWFPQADPSYNFTHTLQNTGGVWWPNDPKFSRTNDMELNKNLMQLSNTRYLMFAKKGWVDEEVERYVVGDYKPENLENREMLERVRKDEEYKRVHKSEHLEVFQLERDMSYCEAIEPFWISDQYYSQAVSQLKESSLPEVPVKGSYTGRSGFNNTEVNCSKNSPQSIEIDTREPTWVLVKESYYPFWERSDRKPVYNAFGFMVTYVNDGAKLVYDDSRFMGRTT